MSFRRLSSLRHLLGAVKSRGPRFDPQIRRGGNIFGWSRRLTEEEYEEECKRLRESLVGMNTVDNVGVPTQVSDKAELVKAFKGSDVKPYGDIDVIVGTRDFKNIREVARALSVVIGMDKEHQPVWSGRNCSLLSDSLFQVDLLFTYDHQVPMLLACRGNNDYIGFLGRLLSKLNLKMTDTGLILKQQITKPGLYPQSPSHVENRDLFLTNDLAKICDFLNLPPRSVDGQTRLSTREVFKCIVQSYPYIHCRRKEYPPDYFKHNARVNRPMFRKMSSYLEEYEGEFEAGKEGSEVRSQILFFRTGKDRPEGQDLGQWEDFVMHHFNRYEEGVKRRRQGLEQSSSGHQSHVSTSFNSLFEWFPAQVDSNEVAVAVMRRLRSKVGGGDPDTFQKWITITPADVLKKEFAVALKELGL